MKDLDNLISKLNEAQRQAVTTDKNRVLVMAGAGSGKTSVLTTRIAHLQLNERVGTSNQLALTFTRLAATEMKERVGKILGDSLAKNLTTGTFHSFCVRVLRTYGNRIGIETTFSVYDTEDRDALIESVIQDLLLSGKVKPTLDPWNEPRSHFEGQVVREYKHRLRRNNALDLDGLLAESVRLLIEHPDIASELQNRYTHIFVDEYQDSDSRQEQIVNLINPQYLFVVGDPAQAIYGWRGAKIDNILTFEECNSDTEVVKMERNYRSTKPILHLANKVIEQSLFKSPLKLWTDKEGPKAWLTGYQCESHEATEIAQGIQCRVEFDGTIPEDVAILCRTNYQVDHYKRALEQIGIKTYVVSNKADPLNAWDVRRIFDYMTYICNPKDDRAFRKIINWPDRRMTDLELQQAEMASTVQMISLSELLEERMDILSSLVLEDWHSDVRILLEQVLENLGLEDRYHSQGLHNRIADLVRAGEAIERWVGRQVGLGESYDPYTFLRWLRTKDIQERLVQEKPEGVQILTVHAAKGLEWAHVYVPGCNLNVFPSKKGDIEEERRLFYVAVTRAKETLHLSYFEERQNPWGKREMVQMKPSPFLKAMEVQP
jgi:DNA helicase-2/ATP-dependent DNA helicase PcrA